MASDTAQKDLSFTARMQQYIGKLLDDGMEPEAIVKELGLPSESVLQVLELKKCSKVREDLQSAEAMQNVHKMPQLVQRVPEKRKLAALEIVQNVTSEVESLPDVLEKSPEQVETGNLPSSVSDGADSQNKDSSVEPEMKKTDVETVPEKGKKRNGSARKPYKKRNKSGEPEKKNKSTKSTESVESSAENKDKVINKSERLIEESEKDITDSSEKAIVREIEWAMAKWLRTVLQENEMVTLYNVLEKAESIANDLFSTSSTKTSKFKVTEPWFHDFRKRFCLQKFRYMEEIEKLESRKLAKRLVKVVPDFVWGECEGCDKSDCPVHEWITSKPGIKKRNINNEEPKNVPIQSKDTNVSATVPKTEYQPVTPQHDSISTPGIKVQIDRIDTPQHMKRKRNGTKIYTHTKKREQDIGSSSSTSSLGSDPSSSIALQEDTNCIVKPEETVVTFAGHPVQEPKNESDIIELGSDSDEEAYELPRETLLEAFEFFKKGMSILIKNDSNKARKAIFCEGLHKLLDLYRLKEEQS